MKRATEVSDALNEAEKAQVRLNTFFKNSFYNIKNFQNAARDAIKKANDDISTTKSDLNEVQIIFQFNNKIVFFKYNFKI